MMERGKRNRISDVPGVKVGNATISDGVHETGVTVVIPCEENPFTHKLPCASFVLNGFGKTAGLMQIEELGTLQTPIALTNTLNVGKVHDAMVEYMIGLCQKDGVTVKSVNPVVCECNDASLNRIEDRAVEKKHVFQAIHDAAQDFAVGAVGCGRGTTCHGLKGGIGSASRVFTLDGLSYTLGVLVQTNHGRLRDLLINGEPVGEEIWQHINEDKPDKGSCIVILATDAPLSDRQLKRVVKRCCVGLIRLGSYIGQGSGEVFIGFSTADKIIQDGLDIRTCHMLNEDRLDICFRAAAECTEEAVLQSLLSAEPVKQRRALREFIE